MLGSIHQFQDELLKFYDASKRDLPWRHTSDPYAILVSEMMLQQTQVKTVIPYYIRFLERFPTPKDLAEASEEELLKMWQGLGYYRRARNLQAAARQIVELHRGRFPQTKTEIDDLKGVGPYTSAAVASIALNLKHACVDGNVIRVITRLFGMDEDVSQARVKKQIQQHASQLISDERPGDFNQAMMELGATVCTPRNPSCMTCPVEKFCHTLQMGADPERRPNKPKKVQPSKISFGSLFCFNGKSFLLCRRPNEGLMAGMWELPSQSLEAKQPWQELLPTIRPQGYSLKPVLHKFTHLHTTYHIDVFQSDEQPLWHQRPKAYEESRWVKYDDLQRLPITKVLQKLLPQLESIMKGASPCQAQTSTLPGMSITS